MGRKQIYEFEVGKCEQIDAKLTTCGDNRGIVSGVVTDKCCRPVCNAVVQLYEINKKCRGQIKPVTHTFTDEFGAFLFGPLCPGMCYGIKVWSMNNRHVVKQCAQICGDKGNCIKGENEKDCCCDYGKKNDHEKDCCCECGKKDDYKDCYGEYGKYEQPYEQKYEEKDCGCDYGYDCGCGYGYK